jgi:hypothetical protein
MAKPENGNRSIYAKLKGPIFGFEPRAVVSTSAALHPEWLRLS